MKKLLFCLLCCFFYRGAFCVDLCANDDVVAVTLDPEMSVVAGNTNSQENMWWVEFKNGYRIYGVSTMLSEAEGGKHTNNCRAFTANTSGLMGDEISAGLSGTYIDETEIEHKREYCWCRMIHPMKSAWIPRCGNAGSCLASCFYYVYTYQSMLGPLFRTVGAK